MFIEILWNQFFYMYWGLSKLKYSITNHGYKKKKFITTCDKCQKKFMKNALIHINLTNNIQRATQKKCKKVTQDKMIQSLCRKLGWGTGFAHSKFFSQLCSSTNFFYTNISLGRRSILYIHFIFLDHDWIYSWKGRHMLWISARQFLTFIKNLVGFY